MNIFNTKQSKIKKAQTLFGTNILMLFQDFQKKIREIKKQQEQGQIEQLSDRIKHL